MSVYKVIQDIEAEDHILGPLSLRQFIFGLIAAFCFYLCYIVIAKGAAFLTVVFLPPALFTGFFAVPFGKDQPTEVWALAKIRFLIKSRVRIWDQSGVKELVTITAPKRIEENRTNGLSDVEVKSRLSALANTIDTRGWAIKNVNVNMYSQPIQSFAPAQSDRLVAADNIPQQVPDFDVQASDDIMDVQNNPIAQQFAQLINNSAQVHHLQLQNMMNAPVAPPQAPPVIKPVAAAPQATTPTPQQNYWFMQEPVSSAAPLPPAQVPVAPATPISPTTPQILTPGGDDGRPGAIIPEVAEPTAEEAAIVTQYKEDSHGPTNALGRMKRILPLDEQQQTPAPVAPPEPPKPTTPSPAAQRLATSNDLNIDVLAREAKRANKPDDGEVVVSLH